MKEKSLFIIFCKALLFTSIAFIISFWTFQGISMLFAPKDSPPLESIMEEQYLQELESYSDLQELYLHENLRHSRGFLHMLKRT